MADINKEVAEKIKDGSYYSDAKEWYARQYLYPVTQRAFLLLIAIIIAFVFVISMQNIETLISEDEPIPVVIRVENSTDYFSVIKPLAEDNETTQDAIAKYLLLDYLKTREEYYFGEDNGKRLRRNLKKIKSSSSKNVLNEYQGYMSETNQYSPVVRFKDHTNRTIELKSLRFIDGSSTSGKAVAVFEALTKNKKTKEEDKSLWEAVIHFRLPDIETIARTGAPLRFLVKYYKAKPIK